MQKKGRIAGRFSLCFSLLFCASVCGAKDQLSIAVATNFLVPLQSLAQEFSEHSEVDIRVTSGSTGKLVAQLLLGAPHDVFFSADQERVEKLLHEGLAYASSRFTYAIGQLVIWVPGKEISGLPLLSFLCEESDMIVIPNPKVAPYGRASEEVLQACPESFHKSTKLIVAENVGQAYSFLETSNARIGFVSLSYVKNSPDIAPNSFKVIPESMHTAIMQDAVMLKQSELSDQAEQFMTFVKSNRGKEIIHSFGYRTP
ncbi:MAG: molybdate ABC transporter substrate-binding protein [Gammaproteobacteria bacterium]|nr:molybdate ABC transporter substrate-binding protein [Gammaproteobacteria bacterium]